MSIPTHHMFQTPKYFVFLCLMAGSMACGRPQPDTRSSSAPRTAAATPATIDIVRVVEQPLDVQLSLPGELAGFQTVAIYPRVAGFVKTMAVDRGSMVRAGDVLATLDAPELVAQRSEAESKVLAAEAQMAAAQAKADADRGTFDRLQAAAATPGVVAGNDVVVAGKAADASRSQMQSAQHAVESARQALSAVRDLESYLRVTAPFDGVVTERNVHPGALVGPSNAAGVNPLLRIVDNRRLRLTVALPEAYTTAITQGADIPFSVEAYPGQTFTGRIARIARSVDIGTRTMAVEMDVANPDARLSPGTFCQVAWPIRRRGLSLFVPRGSIATTTDRTFVIRVRGGTTEWVDVRTGLTAGALIEVFGNLEAGDEVAGRGTDELRPGSNVRPRTAKPTA